MIYFKDRKKKISIIFFSFFLLITLIIIIFSPKNNFKGNFEQWILIFLKEPFLSERNNFYKLKTIPEVIINNFKLKKKYETIYIDINQKNLNRIKNSRKKSLENKVLIQSEYVRLKIKLNNKEYEARAKLKGMLHTHWDRNKQWSLNFKISNGNSIYGFKEFSLTQHSERQFPVNQIVSKSLSRLNIATPDFKTVKVIFNGDDWGLMLIEEQISNAYLEKRKLRDSLVLKLTSKYGFLNELNHFYKKKIEMNHVKNLNFLQNRYGLITYNSKKKFKSYSNNNLGFNEQYSKIINLKEEEELGEIFDIPKFSQVFAMSLIWGELHSLKNVNTRYYLNPYSGMLEIIPTDFNYYMDSSDYKLLSLNYKDNPSLLNDYLNNTVFKENLNFQKIFVNEKFEVELKKSLMNLKKNFKNFNLDLNEICLNYSIECKKIVNLKSVKKNLLYSLDHFNEIIKILRLKSISKKQESFSDTLKNLNRVQKKLFINTLDHPLEIKNIENKFIKIINKTPFKIKITDILITNENTSQKIKLFKINETYDILPSKKKDISIFSLKISEEIKKKIQLHNKNKSFLNLKLFLEIDNIKKIQEIDIFNTYEKIENKYKNNDFIYVKDKNYIIDKGLWIANNPIIIPDGFNLIINEGAEVYFDKKSYILINNGKLISNGSYNFPIKLGPLNDSWRGIFVKSNNKNSTLKYTNIYKTNYFTNDENFLTGGITFYNSNVEINSCIFDSSIAEDSINIVNSKFNIKNSEFKNSISDGIDLDFSFGEIKNTNFSKIGGDALDLSGSDLKIKKLNFLDIKDKSISAGEASKLIGEEISINDSYIGIASKDASLVELNNINILNSEIADLITYKKKSFYSFGKIKINNSKIDNNKIYSQRINLISINGKKNQDSLDLRKNLKKDLDYPFFYDNFIKLIIYNKKSEKNYDNCLNMKCLSNHNIQKKIYYQNGILN